MGIIGIEIEIGIVVEFPLISSDFDFDTDSDPESHKAKMRIIDKASGLCINDRQICNKVINMTETYYARFLQSRLSYRSVGRSRGKVMLVLGARQTGKSTLLAHCVPEGKNVFHINLQDRRLRRRYEADEGLLLREIEAAKGLDTVLIDEVQKGRRG